MFFEHRSSSITKLTKQILDTVSISIPSSCLKQDRMFMYILCIISFMCSERKNTKSLFSSQLFSIYSKNQPCHGLIVVNPPCCQRAWYNLTSQELSTRCTDKDPAGDSWVDEVCTTSTKRWRSAGLMKSKKGRPSTCDFTAGVWAFETFETKALDANGHHLAGRNGTFSGAKCGFTMGFTMESMENGGQGRESPPNFFQSRVTQVTWKWSASSQEHPKDQGAYFMLPPGRVSTSVNWILALNLSKLISGTFVREIFKFYPQTSSRHLKLIDADLLSWTVSKMVHLDFGRWLHPQIYPSYECCFCYARIVHYCALLCHTFTKIHSGQKQFIFSCILVAGDMF